MLSSPPTPSIPPATPTPISVSTSAASTPASAAACGDQGITSSSSLNHTHPHLLNPTTPSDLMVVSTTTTPLNTSSCSSTTTPNSTSPSPSSLDQHHHQQQLHHPLHLNHHHHHPHHQNNHHHSHHLDHGSGQITPPSPLAPLQQNGQQHPTSSSSSSNLGAVCNGCGQPITDRWLMSIGDRCWHERCLTCAVCRHLLTSSCYVRERTLYCKHDYIKLYSVKCNGCFSSIGPSELVMRVAGGAIYHTACFACARCGRRLTKGDEFALWRGGLLCRRDLDAFLLDMSLSNGGGVSVAGAVEPNSPDGCAAGENNGRAISPSGELGSLLNEGGDHCGGQMDSAGQYSPRTSCELALGVAIKSDLASSSSVYSPPPSNNSQSGTSQNQQSQQNGSQQPPPPPNVKPDGRRGPKRPRTILTTAQRRAFKASFEISQKPCRKVRETLAKETGLSVRIVQVWFQNQRAKLKKIQRKQQQAALVHGGNGGGNGAHGGGGNGFLSGGNGSESGTGMGSHSSDKSKDDSTDDEDDDCSSQANTTFGSAGGGNGLQSMGSYGMIQSPDGSYYSTGREDDSTGGNFMMTSGGKSDLGTLDDSETSLCELDDGGGGGILRPNSTGNGGGGIPGTPVHSGGFGPASMMSPLELTCLTGGQPLFSPTGGGSSHPLVGGGSPMMVPFGGPLPLQQQQQQQQQLLQNGHLLSASISESSLTPIDKLYSMQNSYFSSSNSSGGSGGGGGGNPQEQECL